MSLNIHKANETFETVSASLQNGFGAFVGCSYNKNNIVGVEQPEPVREIKTIIIIIIISKYKIFKSQPLFKRYIINTFTIYLQFTDKT